MKVSLRPEESSYIMQCGCSLCTRFTLYCVLPQLRSRQGGLRSCEHPCRIGRIEGILRVIGTDAPDPERVQRAEAAVASLMQQLTELQQGEGTLSELVCHSNRDPGTDLLQQCHTSSISLLEYTRLRDHLSWNTLLTSLA